VDEIMEDRRSKVEKMSVETVEAFYAFLDRNPAVKENALKLKETFPEQEILIAEFLKFAANCGFVFSEKDFTTFLFQRAKCVENMEN